MEKVINLFTFLEIGIISYIFIILKNFNIMFVAIIFIILINKFILDKLLRIICDNNARGKPKMRNTNKNDDITPKDSDAPYAVPVKFISTKSTDTQVNADNSNPNYGLKKFLVWNDKILDTN